MNTETVRWCRVGIVPLGLSIGILSALVIAPGSSNVVQQQLAGVMSPRTRLRTITGRVRQPRTSETAVTKPLNPPRTPERLEKELGRVWSEAAGDFDPRQVSPQAAGSTSSRSASPLFGSERDRRLIQLAESSNWYPPVTAGAVRSLSMHDAKPFPTFDQNGQVIPKASVSISPAHFETSRRIIQLCERGSERDPGNAYFHLMRAAALAGIGRHQDADTAMQTAAGCSSYADYVGAEARGRYLYQREEQHDTSAVIRATHLAAILFPHYTTLRSLARYELSNAIEDEADGRIPEGLRRRVRIAKFGSLLRSGSTNLIGVLVGRSMTMLTCAGLAADRIPYKGSSLTKEQTDANNLVRMQELRRRMEAAGLGSAYARIEVEEKVSAMAAEIGRKGVELGIFDMPRLTVLIGHWAVSDVLLNTLIVLALLTLFASAAYTAGRLTPDAGAPKHLVLLGLTAAGLSVYLCSATLHSSEAPPHATLAAVLCLFSGAVFGLRYLPMYGVAVAAVGLAAVRSSGANLLVICILTIGGVLAALLMPEMPGAAPWRQRLIRAAGVACACVGIIAVNAILTGGSVISNLRWLASMTEANFENGGPVVGISAVILLCAGLVAPLVTAAVASIVSIRRRIPVLRGIARTFALGGPILFAAVTVCYGISVSRTNRLEAGAHAEMTMLTESEVGYSAWLLGVPSPGSAETK
jgi:hypothetical protein